MSAAAIERLRAAVHASQRGAAARGVALDDLRARNLALFSARQREHGAAQLAAFAANLDRIIALLETAGAPVDDELEISDSAYRDAMEAIDDAARDAARANATTIEALADAVERNAEKP